MNGQVYIFYPNSTPLPVFHNNTKNPRSFEPEIVFPLKNHVEHCRDLIVKNLGTIIRACEHNKHCVYLT